MKANLFAIQTYHRLAAALALAAVLLCLALPQPAGAQAADGLTLRLSRDFGYASGSGKIQGTFSMKVSGPDDLQKVTFYIDDQALGDDSEAPFQLRFHTDNYALGEHRLYAAGVTAGGVELRSNEIYAYFVTAD
ncbi:MAG: Ig-like domain-containing protein [Chloroflexota bacterium]